MLEDNINFDSPVMIVHPLGQNFEGMFKGARVFNQPIDNPLFSNATSLKSMFEDALLFNSPVIGWDTSQVTDMSSMFKGAGSFDQDLSTWPITNLTDATSMLDSSGFTTMNYDALLTSWALQAPAIQANVTLGVGSTQYTIATSQVFRDVLTNAPYFWTITDGGGI